MVQASHARQVLGVPLQGVAVGANATLGAACRRDCLQEPGQLGFHLRGRGQGELTRSWVVAQALTSPPDQGAT